MENDVKQASTNYETAQQFLDVVEATERLTKPWKRICAIVLAFTLLSNLLWGSVVFYLVHCAYSDDIYYNQTQTQDIGDGKQEQENKFRNGGE